MSRVWVTKQASTYLAAALQWLTQGLRALNIKRAANVSLSIVLGQLAQVAVVTQTGVLARRSWPYLAMLLVLATDPVPLQILKAFHSLPWLAQHLAAQHLSDLLRRCLSSEFCTPCWPYLRSLQFLC